MSSKLSNFESLIISTKINSLLKTKKPKIRLRSDFIVRLAIHIQCDYMIINLVTKAKTNCRVYNCTYICGCVA